MPEPEKRSWLSPANCTCTWETALLLVVIATACYLLARSVFDVIFWVVISVCIAYGLIYAYFKCCVASAKKPASGGYLPIPAA